MKITKSVIRPWAAALAVSGMLLAGSQVASADTNHKPIDSAMQEYWNSLGVPSDTQAHLKNKLSAGLEIDSASSTAKPTSTENRTVGGYNETISWYEDGSVAIAAVETPNASPATLPREVAAVQALVNVTQGGVSTRSASVGSCQSGGSGSGYSSWRDCKVYGSRGNVAVGFYASYTFINGGPASITNVNSPYANAQFGTATTPVLTMIRATENSSGPATAQASTQYSGAGSGSVTNIFQLYVGGSSAWASWV